MPTPTPWLDTGMFVESAEGGVIASVNEGEDRRFIVRACNSHDDLCEAIEAALNMVDGNGLPPSWDWLREVLARAKGN